MLAFPGLRFFVPLGVAAMSWCGLAGSAAPAAAQVASPAPFRLGGGTPAPGGILPSAPATSPGPVGPSFVPPKVLRRGAVAYPILANLNRIEGTVGVHFVIDESGKVTNATVNKTSRSLTLDAVVLSRGIREWTFQPATLDGKPVPGTYDQDIEFRLEPNEQREFALKRLSAPIGIPDPPYPPEALAIHPHPRGDVTIGVYWKADGLVDLINLVKSSGSVSLDHAALRFAYLNWHIDPKEIKDPKVQYTRVVTFTPPEEGSATSTSGDPASATPPPLATPTPGTPAPSRSLRSAKPH